MNFLNKINEENKVLKPTVVKLGLVSFLADISSEMLYPITPLFLTLVLGASAFNIGVIEGIAEGLASLLKVYSGVWSDRIQKRKVFVATGYFLAALAKPIIGFSNSWLHVLLARSADRFGKGIRSGPRDALLSEAVAPENRGAAFGWHRAMDTFGAACGPLIAILFLNLFYNKSHDVSVLRQVYYWALIPGLLAVLLVLFIQEKQVEVAGQALEKINSTKNYFNYKILNSDFKKYLFSWGLFSLVNSSDVFLILKAQQSQLSLITIILMYVFYNLIYSLCSPYLGGLSDRIGRKSLLILGLMVFSFVYLAFGFAFLEWHFWLLFAIYGFYMAATDGVGKAYAIDLVSPEYKASAIGVLAAVTGFATIFASITAGFLWDHVGTEWCFLYGAVGAAVAATIITFTE